MNPDAPPALSRELTIHNRLGLHARAATRLALLASQFSAQIQLSHESRQASADSVMGVLLLQRRQGQTVTVTVTGSDAPQALEAVTRLFSDGFDEE